VQQRTKGGKEKEPVPPVPKLLEYRTGGGGKQSKRDTLKKRLEPYGVKKPLVGRLKEALYGAG